MHVLQEFHISDIKAGLKNHLKSLGLLVLVGTIFGLTSCNPNAQSERLNSRDLARSTAIADDVTAAELLLSPETASYLGLEALAGEDSSGHLDDHSQAGFERKRLLRIDLHALILMRPGLPEEHPLARDLSIIEDSLERMLALQVIGHGRLNHAEIHPYALDPFSGVWIDVPGLLVNDQLVQSQADAEAFLNRLWALPDAIHDARRRLIADADAGVLPSTALLLETANSVSAFANADSGQLQQIDQTFRNLVQGVTAIDPDMADQMSRDASDAINLQIRPAYLELSTALTELTGPATIHGGLWAQTDGHQTYKRILRWYADHDASLDQLHIENSENVAQYREQLIEALDLAGIEIGSLTERLAQLEVQLNAIPSTTPIPISATDTAAERPTLQNRTANISIRRALTAPPLSGYRYVPGRRDDQRPALISTYPEQVAKWPTYIHSALRLQSDIGLRQPFSSMGSQRRIPGRALAPYPAFQSAWQMLAMQSFAEDYIQTPPEKIGLAHLLLLNAALATADTGLHHKRWTLDETTDYLIETTALPAPLMREATLRIAAKPGEAAARMIGFRLLQSLQNRAKAVLGTDYDGTTFHSILITDGPRPFSMVEEDVDRWYTSKLPASETGN